VPRAWRCASPRYLSRERHLSVARGKLSRKKIICDKREFSQNGKNLSEKAEYSLMCAIQFAINNKLVSIRLFICVNYLYLYYNVDKNFNLLQFIIILFIIIYFVYVETKYLLTGICSLLY